MLYTMNINVCHTCVVHIVYTYSGTLRLVPFFYSWIPLQDTLGRLTISPTDNNYQVLYFSFQETQNRRLITELQPTRCRRAYKILSLCAKGLHLISLLLLLLRRLFLLMKDVTLRSPRRPPGTRLLSTLKTRMRGRNRDFDSEDCRTLLALALSGVIFMLLVICYVVHAHCSWPAPPPPTTIPFHEIHEAPSKI